MHECMYVCMHECMYVRTYVCMYVCMYAHVMKCLFDSFSGCERCIYMIYKGLFVVYNVKIHI